LNLFFTRPDRYWHLGVFPEAQLVPLRIGGAPEFMHGLRILFISDVHLRKSVKDGQLAALIRQIASQRADMLLLGGDYAESTADCLRFFKALEGLSWPMGAYAVPGNNDLDSMPTLRETTRRAGIELLVNAEHALDLPGGRLIIGGCDDHEYGHPRTSGLFRNAGDAYRILLSHYPVRPDCSCDLILSGHTHAGQCNVLGITPYSVGFEFTYHLQGVRGLKKVGDAQMLIGNGIGVSRFPFRLGAQPQIYLVEFGSKDLA